MFDSIINLDLFYTYAIRRRIFNLYYVYEKFPFDSQIIYSVII